MEEKPSKVLPESSDHPGSGKANDIRDLWTTATLSESQLNLPLSKVCENFDEEGICVDRTQWYTHHGGWEDDEEDEGNSYPEELDEQTLLEQEPHQGSSTEPRVGEKGDDSNIKAEKPSSMSSVEGSVHAAHLAYWAEQHNRLPLPLKELMKNEALEILNKALRSYRSGIGKEHFLTKELQRYIDGIKKRQDTGQNIRN
ncbi:PREDICTED: testis-expressed sequence 40 protein [Propithecus coquereli]|uniref:Catsper channel auxiliary subunit zeta n=1 Tax=Propithecus coquereli TaxID=379532 RepID=A0A2K6GYK7_PROCO|nr:PREDICTED: testis-expressed sequence 40 protein [Propithecus coquereli]